jgi:putative ABC transport system permease protein
MRSAIKRASNGVGRDLWLATRRLFATPLFLIFAVASISIGIATTTAAYSILYAILWKPLGIHQPDTVVVVGSKPAAGSSLSWRNGMSSADFDRFDARQQTLNDLSALRFITTTVVTPSSSELSSLEAVSGRFFTTIRLQAALGRMIQPEDDAQRAPVLVLSDATWRNRFAADREVVGKTVRIAGRSFEIVGVAPESFGGLFMPVSPVAGWIPLQVSMELKPRQPGLRTGGWPVAVLGRLGSGRTMARASSEVEAIGAALDGEVPMGEITMGNGSKLRLPRAWTIRPITTADANPTQINVAILLQTLVALVLVVACTNLGNLTLSRGVYRQHELAVRRALGASRWRLVRELFSETLVIAVLASVCTIVLTRLLLMLATLEISTPLGAMSFAPRLNASAAAVSVVALVISMVVFGLEPAFALTGKRASRSLADGVATSGAGRNTRQRAFIRWQVAISVCFFLIAGAITRGIARQAFHDSGIAIDELAIASASATPEVSEAQIQRALVRAATLARQRPDLTSVAVTNGMPFGLTSTRRDVITVSPNRPPANSPPLTTLTIAASPEIFRTLGVPILRGRQFDDRDAISAAHVTVVSEWTATQLFGSIDGAIGRSINLHQWQRDPVTFTVIGVARQTDVGRVTARGDHLVYVPLHENRSRYLALIARTTGSPAGAARVLQDAIRQADPDVGTGQSGPATWVVATGVVIVRSAAALAGSLGVLTLILAMIGLYGVQVQSVAFRTREMGVRMALGAAAAQIKQLVLREGIRPVLEGVLLGLFFGGVTRAIMRASIDYDLQVIDPAVFGAVPIPFAIAALIACYLPARRAARVDPNVALRHL